MPQILLQKLAILGYSRLRAKDDHVNRQGNELGAYVKDGLPWSRDANNEDTHGSHA